MEISNFEDAGKGLDNFSKNSSDFIENIVKNAKLLSNLNYKTLFGVFFGSSLLLAASIFYNLPSYFEMPIFLTIGITGGIIGAKGMRGLKIERYIDDQNIILDSYYSNKKRNSDFLKNEMSSLKEGSKEHEAVQKLYLESLKEEPIIIPLEAYQDKSTPKLLKNNT